MLLLFLLQADCYLGARIGSLQPLLHLKTIQILFHAKAINQSGNNFLVVIV